MTNEVAQLRRIRANHWLMGGEGTDSIYHIVRRIGASFPTANMSHSACAFDGSSASNEEIVAANGAPNSRARSERLIRHKSPALGPCQPTRLFHIKITCADVTAISSQVPCSLPRGDPLRSSTSSANRGLDASPSLCPAKGLLDADVRRQVWQGTEVCLGRNADIARGAG